MSQVKIETARKSAAPSQYLGYTRRSTNLHREYENYARKVNKDGETVGIEDPKSAKHAMSAIRYGLTTLAAAGSTYAPGGRSGRRFR